VYERAAEGGAVGRPHVARALEERGYVRSTQEAFEKYIGRGGPAYVEYEKLTPEQAIGTIHRAGGIPVLAHPSTIQGLDTYLAGLISAIPVLAQDTAATRPTTVTASTATAPTTRPTFTRQQDIVYGRAHGTALTMDRFTPTDRTPNGAAVIFVHGAGYLHNVHNYWSTYFREYQFHHLLASKGYVVLDVDYRGSAGYGRDWRTDVHDFLGGKDYDDHIDSIDFAVANYAVDAKRVGVYGGSYGGFMAGMLVMRAPEKIAAAAEAEAG
jgi:acetyl esterase/lipase